MGRWWRRLGQGVRARERLYISPPRWLVMMAAPYCACAENWVAMAKILTIAFWVNLTVCGLASVDNGLERTLRRMLSGGCVDWFGGTQDNANL